MMNLPNELRVYVFFIKIIFVIAFAGVVALNGAYFSLCWDDHSTILFGRFARSFCSLSQHLNDFIVF